MHFRILSLMILTAIVVTTWFFLALGGNNESHTTENTLDQARSTIGPGWPVQRKQRATTGGSIYLANLDGQIEVLRRRLHSNSDSSTKYRLAQLLYHRFQVVGQLNDAEEALNLLTSDSSDRSVATLLLNASVFIGFHEFERAGQVLDEAVLAGASQTDVDPLRLSISRSLGKAMPLTETQDVSPTSLSPSDLVSRAAAWRDQGRPDRAVELLRQAQNVYTDSSPFTLAWIHVQAGIVFLEAEDYASARIFFAAAHQRFPQYTLAAEHLAETELALGNYEVSARLYREVVRNSGHPEFYHQLSKAEMMLGEVTLANDSASKARQGYRELVEAYPLMFADHAVNYYIDIGARENAVSLATLNLAQRGDERSRDLLATARECCQ